jgi:UDP-N-acetylmuramyl pentapeptide phosphotransferase/UDP-N-acetylglucosamine-1-phosphate transferase
LYFSFRPFVPGWSLLMYTVGAILVVAISWLDDMRSQPMSTRFAFHSVGALLAIVGFGYLQINSAFSVGPVIAATLGVIVTFVWIVGLTNAYNFMDGIDGIAASQAIVGGLCWAALGWLNSQPLILVLGLLLAVSSAGFVLHNWYPARIFMGDVGSAFLGYTFAALPLMFMSQLAWNERTPRTVLAVILPLWPFVFDSVFTFLRRLFLGENVFSAHRSHLYQRLVIAGHGHRFVSLLYAGLAAVGAIVTLAWSLRVPNTFVVAAVLMPLLGLGLWFFVTRQEHKLAQRLPQPKYADDVR